MSQEFKLSDEFLYRIVQIIQESMLLGVDCSDLMRQITVTTQEGQIVLTDAYKKQVTEMHSKWLENAEKLQREEQNVEVAPTNILIN